MNDLVLTGAAVVPSETATDTDAEIARLEAEIAFHRGRVVASWGELRQRVTTTMSWRHWVRTHLLVAITAGVSLGFIIGRGDRHRRRGN